MSVAVSERSSSLAPLRSPTGAALLLIAGALADRFGRRRILVLGLLVMAVGSGLSASASSIETLIAAAPCR